MYDRDAKSLRWLANQFPAVETPSDDTDRLSTCIHLYCTSGAAAIDAMAEQIAALQSENAEKDKELERLKKCRHECKIDCLLEEYNRVCAVLSRVEAERDKAMKALEDMRFAYINKDADCPHQFESEALSCADRLLEQWRGAQGVE